jgi:hypothetical protein
VVYREFVYLLRYFVGQHVINPFVLTVHSLMMAMKDREYVSLRWV